MYTAIVKKRQPLKESLLTEKTTSKVEMRTTEGNLNHEQQTSLLTHQEQPVEGLILASTAPLDSSYSSVEETPRSQRRIPVPQQIDVGSPVVPLLSPSVRNKKNSPSMRREERRRRAISDVETLEPLAPLSEREQSQIQIQRKQRQIAEQRLKHYDSNGNPNFALMSSSPVNIQPIQLNGTTPLATSGSQLGTKASPTRKPSFESLEQSTDGESVASSLKDGRVGGQFSSLSVPLGGNDNKSALESSLESNDTEGQSVSSAADRRVASTLTDKPSWYFSKNQDLPGQVQPSLMRSDSASVSEWSQQSLEEDDSVASGAVASPVKSTLASSPIRLPQRSPVDPFSETIDAHSDGPPLVRSHSIIDASEKSVRFAQSIQHHHGNKASVMPNNPGLKVMVSDLKKEGGDGSDIDKEPRVDIVGSNHVPGGTPLATTSHRSLQWPGQIIYYKQKVRDCSAFRY